EDTSRLRLRRGRCKSEPAVTVRDPAETIGRLNRWNSGTDGESPDGRQRAWAGVASRRTSGAMVCTSALRWKPSSTSIPGARRGEGMPDVFTGIIEEIGEVLAIEPAGSTGEAVLLTVRGPLASSDASHGDSISVNGVCLTVVGL